MAQLMRKVDGSISVHQLTTALRLFSKEDEAFALQVLHTKMDVAPEYNLTRDDHGHPLILLTPAEFKLVARELDADHVRYENVEVQPFSQLSPADQGRVRGWGD